MSERKSVIVDAGFDNTNLSSGMETTKEKVGHWAKEIATMVAGAFAFEKVLEFDKQLGEMAQKLSDTADRLSVNTDEVQKLQYAAVMAGANIDIVAAALDRLAKAKVKVIGGDDPKGDLATAFFQFGITFKDLEALSPDELFHKIGESIEKTGANAKVTAGLMELLGRSGGALIPMLKELRARSDEAPIISANDLANIKKASEEWEGFVKRIEMLLATIQIRLFDSVSWKKFFYGVLHPFTDRSEIDKMFDKPPGEKPKGESGTEPPAGTDIMEGGEGMGPAKKGDLGYLYRRRVQILNRFKDLNRHDSDKTIRDLQTELTGINDQIDLNNAKGEVDKLKVQRGIIARDLRLEQTKVLHGPELEAQYRRIANYSEQLQGMDAQISDMSKSSIQRIADHSATSSKALEKIAGTVKDGKLETSLGSK